MRVFNKYKLYMEEFFDATLEAPWPEKCHLRKVEGQIAPLTSGIIWIQDKVYWIHPDWASECTPKEYHMMWYAKKARTRKKYKNRIERRL